VLVHNNCSTAIEAAMMGRESVMIDWFEVPLVYQASTAVVSHRAKSRAQFLDLVSRAVAGECLTPSDEIQSARVDIITRFFYANDGQAAARVAGAILEAVRPRRPRPSRLAYMRKVVGVPTELGGRVRRAVLVTAGDRVYRMGQSLARRSRIPAAKAFSADHADVVVRRLAAVVPAWRTIQVRHVQREDYALSRWAAGASVRVAAP
jgi:hypothetical protein